MLLSWSGGKDSAWTLHVLRQAHDYEIVALVTTVNEKFDRIAIHGVRRELLELQARAAGLPLWTVSLPWPCLNADYEERMRTLCNRAVGNKVEYFAFGDLFLADIRAYREKQLKETGLTPLFPVWGIPTDSLAREMIRSGVRAKLACIDSKVLDKTFVGRDFDLQLLDDLPASVDRCGENGEFHSFVYAGPMLSEQVRVKTGEIVARDQFVYMDLLSDQFADQVSV